MIACHHHDAYDLTVCITGIINDSNSNVEKRIFFAPAHLPLGEAIGERLEMPDAKKMFYNFHSSILRIMQYLDGRKDTIIVHEKQQRTRLVKKQQRKHTSPNVSAQMVLSVIG